MLTDHPTKKKMSLSVLSIALISCFPFATVQAVPTPVSTPPFFLAASNTEEIGYTFWMVQKHTGDSNSGVALAINGGKLSISISNISNIWDGTAGSRTIHARGQDSLITLQDTNASLAASQASNGDASSVVAATAGGRVGITNGIFSATGNYVRGLSAAGDNPDNGGSSISAENATITTAGNFGIGVQAYGSNSALTPLTRVDLIGGSVTTNALSYAPALQAARVGSLITTHNTVITANGAGNLVVDVNRGGAVELTGGCVTGNGNTSVGIISDGVGSHAKAEDTSITMTGQKSVGVLASAGGSVELKNNTISLTDLGTNGSGLTASGLGSNISATNAIINVKGSGTNGGNAPVGVGAENGGLVTLNGGSVTMEGNNRTIAARAGNNSNIIATGTRFTTNGNNSHAVMAWLNDPTTIGTITLTDATISTAGINSYGITSNNQGAKITANNTNITTSGNVGRGVYAWNGGTVALNGGSITTSGDIASGLQAAGVGADSAAQPAKIDALNINVITRGNFSDGVTAGWDDGSQGIVNFTGGSITTSGELSAGAAARYAGIIGLINTAINTTGDNSTGIISDGDSSYVKAENTNITMAGQKSVGVLANAGGKVDLKNNTISLTDLGTNGSGLTASGVGSNISAINAIINVKGSGTNGGNAPVGVGAENGGLVTLTGGSVTMEGTNRTIAARAGNNSNIIATGTRFTTNGNNSHAVMAWLNDPTTIGTVTLTDATISTAGINSYGITSNNQGAEITASNTNITTSGNVGRGVYAWNGGTVALNGGSITTGGDIASGLQAAGVGADSAAQSAKIDALNVNVTTRGKNSDGVTAGWDDGSQGIVNFTGGSITTSGELSAGVAARYAGNIRLINTTINASGINSSAASADSGGVLNINNTSLTSQKSSGIALTNNATVALNNSTVTANGASISSTLNQAGQTQNITVGLGSKLNVNNGTLLQVNRTAEGMDGIVNLTLGIGSSARGDISDLNGLNANGTRSAGGKTNFIVQKGADWLGSVSGINDVTIGNGSSFVNTGNAPIMGNLRALQNARLQFLNSTTIQGSLDLKEQSNTIFNQNAIIFQNLMAQAASIQFMAMSHIQQSIIAANNSMISFINSARIDADLTGDSSSFAFSQQSDAINRILGNIALSNNSKIKGGTLLNPIIIGGNVDASGGSVLGGNLLVSGALSGTGGTLSPGNSVGTQTYASMAGFSGNYVAEVNSAGLSDKVIIQGNADISAINLSVAQENGNGGYQLNHAYTILQTTNGGTVQNSFASTALDTSFQNTLVKLDPVNYGTDNVQVSLSVDQQKLADKQGDLTSNQRNTLNGDLGAVGQNSAVDAAMLSTDTAKALDQLSGEVHSSLRSSLLASSTMLTDIVNDRARTNAKTNRNENYVWVQALGGSYSLNGDGNTAKSTNKNWGIAVGGAMALQDGWQLGMAAAYNNEDIDVDSRSSSADVDTTSLLAYVSNSWSAGLGNVNLLAGGGYSWHNIDTQRDVSLVNQNITSSYNANTTQLFTDLGYEIPVIDSFTVEPYTGIGWYRQKTNDFTEHGGSAALRGQGDTQDVTTYNLGVRSKLAFAMGNTPASVNMSAGWRHAAGDIDSDVRLNLAQGQGSAYTVTGAPLSKDAAVLAFGVEAEVVKNAVVGVSYNGQVASDNSSNSGTLYMKYTF